MVSEEKASQFHILRSLMEHPDVTELVNACDAGREGELIFRLVYEAGWLIGINAIRLFSALYHRTLNVGRVQTPTLAMLADRDSKIVLFRKEKYHHVRLTLDGAKVVSEKISDLEDAKRRGIGTPATRAAIIEKLVSSEFVERKGKNPIPTKAGINLVAVPPELVRKYSHISEKGRKLFQPEKETVGLCPRCGKPVYEGKKIFVCLNHACQFVMRKNDRIFE